MLQVFLGFIWGIFLRGGIMDFDQIRKKYDKGKELSNIQQRFNGLIQEAKG